MNYAFYKTDSGAEGMSSIRSELINAMFITSALNLTLILDDSVKEFFPFRTAYDIPLMRHLHLTSPMIGTTFAWMKELRARRAEFDMGDIDQSRCFNLLVPPPFKNKTDRNLNDMVQMVVKANSFLRTPWNSS